MNRYQRLPHIQVFEPPPWYQVQFAHQRRQLERHDDTMHAIRAQLEAAAKGGCTPEVALLAIAVIIRDTDRNVGDVWRG